MVKTKYKTLRDTYEGKRREIYKVTMKEYKDVPESLKNTITGRYFLYFENGFLIKTES